MRWQIGNNIEIHLHDKEKKFIDIFKPVVTTDKLHPFFTRVLNDAVFSSAKEIITKTMPHFKDVDGNFVEQFQTGSFEK